MSGLRAAIGFLTILPIAPRGEVSLATARAYFPLVGLMLGCILAALELLRLAFIGEPLTWQFQAADALTQPTGLLFAALIVAVLIALSRALHLDGFMDSCDALLGGFERQRRLAILRDPNVGAFAVVGVVCLLLIKVGALMALTAPMRLPALILFPCLARWAMLLTMEIYPYARERGIGSAFFAPKTGAATGSVRIHWQLIVGFGITLLASLMIGGLAGITLLAAACGVAWALGAWAQRLLGGVTGDIYGAVNETAEVAVLLLAAAMPAAGLFALQSPLMTLLVRVVG